MGKGALGTRFPALSRVSGVADCMGDQGAGSLVWLTVCGPVGRVSGVADCVGDQGAGSLGWLTMWGCRVRGPALRHTVETREENPGFDNGILTLLKKETGKRNLSFQKNTEG